MPLLTFSALPPALVLALVVLLAGRVSCKSDRFAPGNPLPCACSDVDVREDFTTVKIPYSCWEQSNFDGVCGSAFLLDTPEEVPEGYCQISCGRCSCCKTFSAFLRESAYEFSWMLNLTEFKDKAAKPGFEATMLVPSDAAMTDMLSKLGYGGGRSQVENDAAAVSKVKEVIRLHILPPEESMHAVWTLPFMRDGAWMKTMGTRGLSANLWEGSTKISGPSNEVWATSADIPTCKGTIIRTDKALLPPSGSDLTGGWARFAEKG